MKSFFFAVLLSLLVPLLLAGQTANQQPSRPSDATSAPDYSGMYGFLREGEFLQLTIEDDGRVTGFISRFGDQESDRGAFLNQFFKKAKLEGKNLQFTTETVHGIWYEFDGSVVRGAGKSKAQEGYFVLRGTLVQNSTESAKKNSPQRHEVAFKSFPEDADQPTQPPHD